MKGSIVQCLEELVVTQFGRDTWETVLQEAGVNKTKIFLPFQDVDDALVMRIVNAVCHSLHISLPQAADAFGEYWVMVYSQRMYAQYYAQYSTAKDFLLGMDKVHIAMTRNIPNAQPPRFDYAWKNATTLRMRYKSKRGLIDFVVGLAKSVGTFYREDLQVTKVDDSTIEIRFRSSS